MTIQPEEEVRDEFLRVTHWEVDYGTRSTVAPRIADLAARIHPPVGHPAATAAPAGNSEYYDVSSPCGSMLIVQRTRF